MAGINLVIDQYTSKSKNIHITLKKSNTSKFIDIPFHLDNYGLLLEKLEPYVKPEWRTAINDLYHLERQCIAQRQALMSQYKTELAQILPPIIAQFQQDHPEYFI